MSRSADAYHLAVPAMAFIPKPFVVWFLCHFLLLITAANHLLPFVSQSLSEHTMADSLGAFCQAIGLSAADSDALRARHDEAEKNTGDALVMARLDVACEAAKKSLGPDKVDLHSSNLTRVNQNWSESCIAVPHCIITPETPEDVSTAMRCIVQWGVKFAVRSGGHSPNPGWSSVGKQGVLIDLQKLNQIVLSSDGSVVSVGPGARWGDVYAALDSHGLSVIGGRVPDVGVAGLILGGGLSYFTGKYGTAADNVQNFEIVLADGTVENANATSNPELFWALKGGGPNFGIVTRFDLSTIPLRDIWYQASVYSVDQADTILDAYAKWQVNEGAVDTKATIGLGIGLDMISVGLVYAEPADRPSVFAPFYELESLALAAVVPPTNGTVSLLTTIMAGTGAGKPRHDYRASSTPVDAEIYKAVHMFWRQKALAARELTGANQTFTVQHIPQNVAKQGIAKGGNPMNIPEITHGWWTTLVDWEKESDDATVRSVAIETAEMWKKLSEDKNEALSYLFMNDASRDQNPLASYGTENVAKLKEISLKYDKQQVFQRLQNDGFLLSRI